MTPDCRLKIAGAWFADSALELAAGAPTALADLDLTWGRGTTVDQPDAATCRIGVLDYSGGETLLDALPIGAPLEVWAAGDIGAGAPVNVAVDPSFETLPLGPAGNRTHGWGSNPATVTVTDAPTATGTRALTATPPADLPAGEYAGFVIPAAAFTPGDPTGWDEIPRLGLGQQWSWALEVLGPRGARVQVSPQALDGPEDFTGTGIGGAQILEPADYTWHRLTGTFTVGSSVAGRWPAVAVTFHTARWQETTPPALTTSWADTPGTWAEYTPNHADNLELVAPPSVMRDVLVFAGRVTDLTVTVDIAAGTGRADLIATDQSAELVNRYVGDTPWPAESVATRVGKILAATGLDIDTRIDAPLGAEVVSARDVDRQAAGALLIEIAAGIDAVLWSATHATLGPYLWFENVALRASLGTLTLDGGYVVIVIDDSSERAPGTTALDGCELAATGVTWRRDVTDVLNRVDAAWLDQTTTPPTERNVTVADAAAEAAAGTRRIGVQTNLTTAGAATAVANRILARTRIPQWRTEGLEVDCGRWPPTAGDETADVLDLLDGTIRLGRPIVVTDIAGWPGGDTAGGYLDGGSYRFDGAWRLGLAITPMGGFGESAEWDDLDPTWRWNQMDPDMAWSDLYGVTGPLATMGE